jgi:hypothetical protein
MSCRARRRRFDRRHIVALAAAHDKGCDHRAQGEHIDRAQTMTTTRQAR